VEISTLGRAASISIAIIAAACDAGEARVPLSKRIQEHDLAIRNSFNSCEAARADVIDELARLAEHPWAGEYKSYIDADSRSPEGDETIYIAPSAGIVWVYKGGTGISDCNYGELVSADTAGCTASLHLPLLEQRREYEPYGIGCPKFSLRISFVRWNSYRFAIPDNRIQDFCNSINSRDRVSVDRFPHMIAEKGGAINTKSQWDKLPVLGAEYRSMLLASPVDANVIQVSAPSLVFDSAFVPPTPMLQVKAVVDIGVEHGMRPGMLLYRDGWFPICRITDVEPTKANVEFVLFADNAKGEVNEGALPVVGWHLSTVKAEH
jgi:hypothetical protein